MTFDLWIISRLKSKCSQKNFKTISSTQVSGGALEGHFCFKNMALFPNFNLQL